MSKTTRQKEAAEKHLRTAIALREEFADAHFDLGMLLVETGG